MNSGANGTAVLRFKRMPQLPLILQNEVAECGHACVAMISNFWGHDLDLEALRKRNQPSQLGSNLLGVKALLEQLGFTAYALSVPLDALKSVKTPAILHWNMNHFVVLKQVKKNAIVIHDPATGVRSCRFDEVSKSFTGIVLEVEKAPDFKALKEKQSLSLLSLVKTARGVNQYLLLLILLSLSIEVFSLLNPLFMQYVTDDVIGSSGLYNLYAIASAFVLLVVIQSFTEYIRGNMVIYLTKNLTEQFSTAIMTHLLRLPLTFFEKRHKGDIQARFQSIEQIQQKISTDFVSAVLDGFMILVNIAVMMVYSWLLAAIVFVSLGCCFMMRYLSYQSLRQQTEQSIVLHAKTASIFLETLQAIIPIKSFLKEQTRLKVWRNYYIQSLNADIHIAKMNVLYHVMNHVMFHIEPIIVVCVGASLVLTNQFSLGMLLAFLSYRLLLVNKASSLFSNFIDYKLISIELNRLKDIVFQEPERVEKTILSDKGVQGSLVLQNVYFKYNDNAQDYLLNNINLTVHPGEKLAIIGPSGAGKSTLLKVMMGLLPVSRGEVYLDHCSIKDYGMRHHRSLTASVMQDDVLLSGSILDNIAFFDDQIDLARVYEVAQIACIHDTIMRFPMAYETLVGDMGSTLSGGQRQRILLARALYKQPKILFLDEATSHLDVANERAINQALRSLAITQVIVAHRQETIAMADRVIDLQREVNKS